MKFQSSREEANVKTMGKFKGSNTNTVWVLTACSPVVCVHKNSWSSLSLREILWLSTAIIPIGIWSCEHMQLIRMFRSKARIQNVSFIPRCHNIWPVKGCKLRDSLGAVPVFWAGADLCRASRSMTRNLGFFSIIRCIAPLTCIMTLSIGTLSNLAVNLIPIIHQRNLVFHCYFTNEYQIISAYTLWIIVVIQW